jgi:hypothetical protein
MVGTDTVRSDADEEARVPFLVSLPRSFWWREEWSLAESRLALTTPSLAKRGRRSSSSTSSSDGLEEARACARTLGWFRALSMKLQ